eukprot:6207536-Pleurochrysis_carterae.AAC.1
MDTRQNGQGAVSKGIEGRWGASRSKVWCSAKSSAVAGERAKPASQIRSCSMNGDERSKKEGVAGCAENVLEGGASASFVRERRIRYSAGQGRTANVRTCERAIRESGRKNACAQAVGLSAKKK